MPYHPTGNTVETLWNPFAIGVDTPNPFPPFNGTVTVVGLNKGWCISMTGGNDCGEWFCQVHATFYGSPRSILSCFPPDERCVATQAGDVIGTVQYSGIWPSCANPNADFNFPLIINGGTCPLVLKEVSMKQTNPL